MIPALTAFPLPAKCRRPEGAAVLVAAALVLGVALVPAGAGASSAASPPAAGGPGFGATLPLWSIVPFVGILLSIALFPLFRPHFWHHHYPKVAAFWGLLLAVPFLLAYREQATHAIAHTYLHEYVPFIILLWALFTVAGGIVVRGTMSGSPRSNTLLLLVGTLIASWVGTTGASMLLIHPLLRGLENRRNRAHTVIFFIFLVSNIGGLLTPLGDPPLFLGFLSGVPFFWTLRLLPELLLLMALTFPLYYFLDRRYYAREGQAPATAAAEPVRLQGLGNLPLLLGIMGSVLLSGMVHLRVVRVLGVDMELQNILRDLALVLIGVASLRLTPRQLRAANQFTWAPMREVAYLFAGIFMTMIPALAILRAGEAGHLGGLIRMVDRPSEYFWMTGLCSSVLDNAPTYLTFLNTALGKYHAGVETRAAVHLLIDQHGVILAAISCAAVFMGAMTYIGNAPNFMVRSIAEERGVAMPSFLGYLVRWSVPLLVPSLVLLNLVFFR